MFLLLLLVTLALSIAISLGVIFAFNKPLSAILFRIIADPISAAWHKYLKFAILVVGVSSGVRIGSMEKYIEPARWEKDARIVEFTLERWVLELYRTALEALQGIAWMLLIFFMFALVAYVIVRIAETRLGAGRPAARDQRIGQGAPD